MFFTSFEFVLFFALVLLVANWLRASGPQKWFLLSASFAFYMSWSIPCVLLILFTSITDFSITRRLGHTANPTVRRRLLFLSLGANLGLLAFFKYANFFLENISIVLNGLGWHSGPLHLNIPLPPAISFFTFASMGYVIDVYYERIPPSESLRDYTLFLSFFPKLLSGPIVRGNELLPQLKSHFRTSIEEFEAGISCFLVGAVKKLVIADQVAPHVNLIFAAPDHYDGLTLLLGALGYTVQIYCDFAGYSDMAIGCARMLGIRLPENFQMPYSSANMTEFWRRWHITLSRWFRDYLFLPLEMATRSNPSPLLRVSINMMVTMLLCGLWHGPSWNFVVWGGIHGAALVAHKAWTQWGPLSDLKKHPLYQWLWTACSHFLTMGVVVLSMVFFRAETFASATSYLYRLLTWAHDGSRLLSPYILAGVLVVFLVHLLINKDRNLSFEIPRLPAFPRVLGYASLLFFLVVFGATDAAAFIYFQF